MYKQFSGRVKREIPIEKRDWSLECAKMQLIKDREKKIQELGMKITEEAAKTIFLRYVRQYLSVAFLDGSSFENLLKTDLRVEA